MQKRPSHAPLAAGPAVMPEVSATAADGEAPDGGAGGATPAPRPVVPGGVIGRYLTLSILGSGGMGVVYAAYDPELERKVALKLLRPRAVTVDCARLLREARTLARVAHPNVVSVFDVGTLGDEVFVAMEFVEGVTLSRWLRERPRTTRELLEVFVAAARGLAAAHRANVIHRDFKPKYRRLSQTAPQPTDRPHSHELGRFERVSLLRLAPRCPALPQVLAKSWQRVGPRGRCSRAATMRQ